MAVKLDTLQEGNIINLRVLRERSTGRNIWNEREKKDTKLEKNT